MPRVPVFAGLRKRVSGSWLAELREQIPKEIGRKGRVDLLGHPAVGVAEHCSDFAHRDGVGSQPGPERATQVMRADAREDFVGPELCPSPLRCSAEVTVASRRGSPP